MNYDEEEEHNFRDKEEEKIRNENGLIDYEKLERLIDLKNRDKQGVSSEALSSTRSGSINGKIEKVKK